ncbi:MAG: amino acid adenylation domain-containing protein, partial [bacterium]|nr:amino acid adenylation domain-containing protein [bacterium]
CSLIEQGINEEDFVGIMTDRSFLMLVGILGIIKAGCAYVPVNPKTPVSRLHYMLEECDTRSLVTTQPLFETVFGHKDSVLEPIFLDRPGVLQVRSSSFQSPAVESLAYVIFTSGSTGKPKGVPITYANISPFLHWWYRYLDLGTGERFIQNLSYYFDWSVGEIMLSLTTGSALYLTSDDTLIDPRSCIAFMEVNHITVLHITPSQFQYILDVGLPLTTLKYLLIGAEAVSKRILERSFEKVARNCRIFNAYGPTECTILSATLELNPRDVDSFEHLSSVPIGGPLGNTMLFVLDNYLKLCPLHV